MCKTFKQKSSGGIFVDRVRFEGWWNAWEILRETLIVFGSAFDWDISSLLKKKTSALNPQNPQNLLGDGNLLKCDAQQLKEWRGMHRIL